MAQRRDGVVHAGEPGHHDDVACCSRSCGSRSVPLPSGRPDVQQRKIEAGRGDRLQCPRLGGRAEGDEPLSGQELGEGGAAVFVIFDDEGANRAWCGRRLLGQGQLGKVAVTENVMESELVRRTPPRPSTRQQSPNQSAFPGRSGESLWKLWAGGICKELLLGVTVTMVVVEFDCTRMRKCSRPARLPRNMPEGCRA